MTSNTPACLSSYETIPEQWDCSFRLPGMPAPIISRLAVGIVGFFRGNRGCDFA